MPSAPSLLKIQVAASGHPLVGVTYLLLVVGGSLVLNAALFRILLRRKRQFFPFADNADAIYLYSVGALFLLPQTAASILNLVANLAVRCDWNRYLEYHNLILALIGVWCLFTFRRAGKMIAGSGGRFSADS